MKNLRKFRNLFNYKSKDWSEEVVEHMSRTLKIANFTGATLYNWNAGKQELELSQSRTRFAIFVSQFLVYMAYELFVICRLISYTLDKNATTKDKGVLQYTAIGFSMPILCQVASFFHIYNGYTYFNRLLHFMRNDFKRLPHEGEKEGSVGKLMTVLMIVGITTFTLDMSTLFLEPELPQLLTSLLPNKTKRSWWESIPFVPFHGFIWVNQWGVLLFYCTLVLSYITATQNALDRTRPNRRLSPEGFYRATRKLEIMQASTNAMFRWIWYSVEMLFVPVIVYGFCGSVWNEGATAAKLLLVAIVLMAVLLKVWSGLGKIFETSSEVLAEWQKRRGMPSLLFRKKMKSVRPIRVQIGHYYADAGVTLTLLSIISENTMSVLLAA